MAININGTGSITGLSSISSPTISGGNFPAGTAASPGITLSGDADTGLYSPGANQIAIATSGVAALTVDASQRVGLGTSSPSDVLHVVGTIRTSSGANNAQFANNYLRANGAGTFYIDHNTGGESLQFRVSNVTNLDTTALTITSAGRVGVGTSTPDAVFGIGDIQSGTRFHFARSSYADIFGGFNHLGDSGGFGIYNVNSSADRSIRFLRGSSYAGLSESARFDSSGRLLVGTSSSSTDDSLVLQGNSGGSTGGADVRLRKGALPSADSQGLGTLHFGDNSGNVGARIAGISEGAWTSGSNHRSRLVFSTTADGASSPTERARITNAGYSKFTDNGTYAGAASPYHEFRSTASDVVLLIRQAQGGSGGQGVLIDFTNIPNNTTQYHLRCMDQSTSTTRSELRSNGGLANYQANNVNLSDINTKKDISPAAGTWDCIKEWEIVNYRYKDQPDDADLNLGVIAQQVAESCPEVITVFQEAKEATEDQPAQEERLGIKEQQMYWMAIKALQEAQVRIEQLEAKVAALESA